MLHEWIQTFRRPALLFLLAVSWLGGLEQPLLAVDYFLTIGGGYSPSGNQASLEANVIFFQQLLTERHDGPRTHEIFFADGHDAKADLQVLADKSAEPHRPATELLAALHRRQDEEQVEYRDHRVPEVAGPLDPALIRRTLQKFAKKCGQGDRLIVYVTAHGSPGGKGEPHNTTIDCWNEKQFTAREFTRWLKDLPSGVPVVMVMAQCYCGGFAHTIFDDHGKHRQP